MVLSRSAFCGRPPFFLPGTWLLFLGTIAFCYSIVSIGIVYGDTENENLKIAALLRSQTEAKHPEHKGQAALQTFI